MRADCFNGNDRGKNHHHLGSLEERYDLIARILNAKIENQGLIQYQSILDNEFLEFTNGVDSLKGEALALLALQEIQKELQLVASFPSLFQKTMVAVGGGFSAGKSAFLNNLLNLKLKLPEDISPTTAIPTYCLKGKREVLMGRSQSGGMVELPHLAFDRAFLKAFGFNLKEIMPFMLLSAPSMPFEFLCFIDTPGHNPGNQGYTSEEKEASKEYLRHAKHILWLINCECGEIQRDDLKYLQELYDEEKKQVFIVLSRADSRTKSQLEEIANKIKETLEDHGIEFKGICTHSSTRYQEYREFSEKSPVFNSLEKFLIKLNKRSEKQKEILGVLYDVFSMYERDIKQDASKFKRYQSELRSVGLDFMQKGFDDFSDKIFRRIEILEKEFFQQEQSKRENLVQLNEVINLFKESIDKVFDSASAFTWEKYKEQNGNEEDEEENYREFEEIQKRLKRYKERNNGVYQDCLNDERLQNKLRKWRKWRKREFEQIREMILFFRDFQEFSIQCNYNLSRKEIQDYSEAIARHNNMLQLDYSPENFYEFKRFKEVNEKDYENLLNDERLQNKLQKWRRTKRR